MSDVPVSDLPVSDVLVAGGGPIGLATALHVHAAGLTVTVVEPRQGPMDKACGEGLMPGAVRLLAELGVNPLGQDVHGIRYRDGHRTAEAPFRNGFGRGVRRTELQRALRATVDEHAIPVVCGAVTDIVQDRHGVRACGLSARYLVAADGLHSGVRRSMNLVRNTDPSARRWGQRRHFEMAPWTNYIEVHWGAASEAYVTPVGDGLVGVAILSSHRTPFDEQLRNFPDLIERISDSTGSRVMGAGPLRQTASRRVAGRVLLVGDAAGYVDALTGDGIAVGLDSGRRLAQCLAEDRPDRYESEWRRSSRRYRAITGSLLRATAIPRVRGAIVPLAERVPALFQGVVRQLSG